MISAEYSIWCQPDVVCDAVAYRVTEVVGLVVFLRIEYLLFDQVLESEPQLEV